MIIKFCRKQENTFTPKLTGDDSVCYPKHIFTCIMNSFISTVPFCRWSRVIRARWFFSQDIVFWCFSFIGVIYLRVVASQWRALSVDNANIFVFHCFRSVLVTSISWFSLISLCFALSIPCVSVACESVYTATGVSFDMASCRCLGVRCFIRPVSIAISRLWCPF